MRIVLYAILLILFSPLAFAEELNETEELEEPENEECSLSLSIATEKQIYEEGETISFTHILSNKSYETEIEYWIEDLDKSLIKAPKQTSSLTKKQFTPSIGQQEKVLLIKSKLISSSCPHFSRNETQAIVIIKKGSINVSLSLAKIPEKIKFGSKLSLDLKGMTNLSESELIIQIKKDKTILNEKIKVKDQIYELEFPLFLPSNCNQKYASGIYSLSISDGINRIEKQIQIENASSSECPQIKKKSTTKPKAYVQNKSAIVKKSFNESNINARASPFREQETYTSSSAKTKNLAPYFYGAGLLVLAILLFKGEIFNGINSSRNYRNSGIPGRTYQERYAGSPQAYQAKSKSAVYQRKYRRSKKAKRKAVFKFHRNRSKGSRF